MGRVLVRKEKEEMVVLIARLRGKIAKRRVALGEDRVRRMTELLLELETMLDGSWRQV